MKAPPEIATLHRFLAVCAGAIIGTAQHEPMVFFNSGLSDSFQLSLAEWFLDDEGKAIVAEALKSLCTKWKPVNVALISEATVGEPEEGEQYTRAEDCRVHYDVLDIQIEAAGAIHLWTHRLHGEFPERTMDAGQYHRHGPMDWGRFVLMPENQQEVDPCQSN